jgi:hypothetical protein
MKKKMTIKKKKKEDVCTFVIMLFYLSLLPCSTTAWGEFGHEIVANLAWSRLVSTTQDKIASLLNITNTTLIHETGSPLAAVANWADHVRYYFPWSAELHYIDIRDNLIKGGCHYQNKQHHQQQLDDSSLSLPCDDCVFEYDRDCPEDICVAGAILNYSTQLVFANKKTTPHFPLRRQDQYGKTSDNTYQSQQEALKFLIQ